MMALAIVLIAGHCSRITTMRGRSGVQGVCRLGGRFIRMVQDARVVGLAIFCLTRFAMGSFWEVTHFLQIQHTWLYPRYRKVRPIFACVHKNSAAPRVRYVSPPL